MCRSVRQRAVSCVTLVSAFSVPPFLLLPYPLLSFVIAKYFGWILAVNTLMLFASFFLPCPPPHPPPHLLLHLPFVIHHRTLPLCVYDSSLPFSCVYVYVRLYTPFLTEWHCEMQAPQAGSLLCALFSLTV